MTLAFTVAAQQRFDFGTRPSESEIKTVDIAVGPKGEGLPAGKGSVQEGEKVYAAKCVFCHGQNGSGGPYDQLVGGVKPVKTIGSFWPYASTIFDYTRRAMPFNKPGSLTDNEVYASNRVASLEEQHHSRRQRHGRDHFTESPDAQQEWLCSRSPARC